MKCKIEQCGYDYANGKHQTREIIAGQFDGRNLDHPTYSNANIFAGEFFEYTPFIIRITENGGFTVEYGADPYWMKTELGMDIEFWLRVVRESIEHTLSRGENVEVCPMVSEDESESDDDDDDDEDEVEWDSDCAYIVAA